MKRCPYCHGVLMDGPPTWVRYSCDFCWVRWEKNGTVRYWLDRTWIPGWAEVPDGTMMVRDI